MKKRSFSILEVLIAIGILAFLGAALAINFYKSHQERKEKDTLDIIESKLRMAAQLAKMSDAEVRVIFPTHTTISFDSDLAVSNRMKANLSRTTKLPYVKEITIEPNTREELSLSLFPSKCMHDDLQIKVLFDSGREVSINPAKYLPNLFSEDRAEIEAIFPHEILDDANEET